MNTVTLTIDGQQITVPEKYTILQAAKELGIYIPRLCYLKDINETSACRICVMDRRHAHAQKLVRRKGSKQYGRQNQHPARKKIYPKKPYAFGVQPQI